MLYVTDFADQAVILPLILGSGAMLALSGWPRAALAWMLAAGGALGGILVLKLVFAPCDPLPNRQDFFSPSGHTAAAVVAYGGLGLILRLPGVAVFALGTAVAVLVGLSRVWVGAHNWPEVAVGAAIGLLGLWAFPLLTGEAPRPRRIALLAPAAGAALLFHGMHLHAEPVVGRLARLLHGCG